MKTAIISRKNARNHPIPRYPGAADRRYFLRKLLDGALAVATGVGAFVVFAFLFLQ